LREDYQEFARRGGVIVAVGPDSPEELREYWARERIPFVGLADPRHEVADRYGQEVNLLRLGRMPALLVVDAAGQIRYARYSTWMTDYPPTAELLVVLDRLLAESPDRVKLD
jgi:peroxiredoxin Q/BCP